MTLTRDDYRAQVALDVLAIDVTSDSDEELKRAGQRVVEILDKDYGHRTEEVHIRAIEYSVALVAEVEHRVALKDKHFDPGQKVRMIAIQPGPGAAGCSGLFDRTSLGAIGYVEGPAPVADRISVKMDLRDLGYGEADDEEDNFKTFYLSPGIFEAVEA